MTDGAHPPGTDDGPETPPSLRQRIQQQAAEYGVNPDHLLIQSRRRDPMYKGTEADHRKARWFADLWEQAVAGRESDRIHIRGVHYFIVMSTDDGSTLNPDQLPVSFDPSEFERLTGPIEPPTDCSWSAYENTDRCYDYLESAGTLARILGYIPLGGIYDNKHDQTVVTRYGEHAAEADTSEVSVPSGVDLPPIPEPDEWGELEFDGPDDLGAYLASELVGDLAGQLSFDTAQQHPFHVEVWCEKGLPDYIHTVARDMDVNVVVEGEGDLSLTIAHEFVERVRDAEKPAVILYLSDFDAKGDAMSSGMAGKIAWLDARGDLSHRVCIEQVAVTQGQVERFGLPRKPIAESDKTGTGAKAYDTLVSEWEERKGAGACELNTLEQLPELYQHIVREAIAPYRADDLRERNREAVRNWLIEVRDAIESAVDGDDLADDLPELRAWLETWNTHLSDVQPGVRRLNELKREGFYSEWREHVEDTIDGVEWPAVSVPEGDEQYPDDPLYDSERAYVENVRRVQRHKAGDADETAGE